MASDLNKNESAHVSVLEGLREELEPLRHQGGISEQFMDWHRRLTACAAAITKDVPSCADLCKQLMSKDFEMPPEFARTLPYGLGDQHQIVAAASKTFFRSRCGEVDEILKILIIVLQRTGR